MRVHYLSRVWLLKCNRSTAAAAAAACENRQSTATVAEMDRRTGQTDQLHTVSGSSMRLFNEPPKWLVMRCMRLHKIVNKSSPTCPPSPSLSHPPSQYTLSLSLTSPASFSLRLSFFAFTVESLRSAANALFAAATTGDSKSDSRFFNTRLLWLKYFTTYITTHTVTQSHVKAIKLPKHTHSRTHSFAFLIIKKIKKSQ